MRPAQQFQSFLQKAFANNLQFLQLHVVNLLVTPGWTGTSPAPVLVSRRVKQHNVISCEQLQPLQRLCRPTCPVGVKSVLRLEGHMHARCWVPTIASRSARPCGTACAHVPRGSDGLGRGLGSNRSSILLA